MNFVVSAGLTISEKMRKQIRGLDKASSNAQDGVSSVQTAEGALTEVHSMLQRMNELAVQAANGTNSKDTDRKAIQDEIPSILFAFAACMLCCTTILIIESSLNSRYAGYYVFSSGNPFPKVFLLRHFTVTRHKHL